MCVCGKCDACGLWFGLIGGDGKENTLFWTIFMTLFIRTTVVGSALCLGVFVLMWWNFDGGYSVVSSGGIDILLSFILSN